MSNIFVWGCLKLRNGVIWKGFLSSQIICCLCVGCGGGGGNSDHCQCRYLGIIMYNHDLFINLTTDQQCVRLWTLSWGIACALFFIHHIVLDSLQICHCSQYPFSKRCSVQTSPWQQFRRDTGGFRWLQAPEKETRQSSRTHSEAFWLYNIFSSNKQVNQLQVNVPAYAGCASASSCVPT